MDAAYCVVCKPTRARDVEGLQVCTDFEVDTEPAEEPGTSAMPLAELGIEVDTTDGHCE